MQAAFKSLLVARFIGLDHVFGGADHHHMPFLDPHHSLAKHGDQFARMGRQNDGFALGLKLLDLGQ